MSTNQEPPSLFLFFPSSSHVILILSLLLAAPSPSPAQQKRSAVNFPSDPKGYIMFCPCMGRFGNQVAQFLGAMSFAKALDRTLVLPHWIEYVPYKSGSLQIPFESYFRYPSVNAFHKSVTMDYFMGTNGEDVWPKGSRISMCYGPRHGDKDDGCNAKDGNPFGPYWDHFGVDFDESSFYGKKGLYYCNVNDTHMVQRWKEEYPSEKYPVLAFTGTPGDFPVKEKDVPNQKYLLWSDNVWKKAEKIVVEHLKMPFLAIHLRRGDDFQRACKHVDEGRNFFGSAQCLGYNNEKGFLSQEICFPSKKTILKQVKDALKKYKTDSLFIATDSDTLLETFQKKFPKLKIYTQGPDSDFKVDLCVMGMASHWIGNCVSTFSGHAFRSRKVAGKSVEFWGFPEHAIPNPNAPKELKFRANIDMSQDGTLLKDPVVQQVKDEL